MPLHLRQPLHPLSDSMHRFRNLLSAHWGFVAALAVWVALAIVNLLDLTPSIQHRAIRHHGGDFDQYYAGAVAAKEGLWDSLYPVDLEKADYPMAAQLAPDIAATLSARGATRNATKFIYPPPFATILLPLAGFSFTCAMRLFAVLSFAALLWFLALFRRECDDCRIPRFWANALIFAVGTGIPACESIMMGNATPFVGLAALLVLRGLRRNQTGRTVLAFAIAGLTKGFSAPWVPALLIWRKWHTIVAGATCVLVLVAVTALLGAHFSTYETFVRTVIPASRGHLYYIGDSNLGLPSILAWCIGKLPESANKLFAALQIGLITVAYTLAWRVPRQFQTMAQGLALFMATLSFQICSFICWPQYVFNIIAFLPLALRASLIHDQKNRAVIARFVIVATGFALAWFPIGNAAKYLFHVPLFGFGRLFGYLILLAWGYIELARLSFSKKESRNG